MSININANRYLRFLWGPVDLKSKLRKILNEMEFKAEINDVLSLVSLVIYHLYLSQQFIYNFNSFWLVTHLEHLLDCDLYATVPYMVFNTSCTPLFLIYLVLG